MLCSLVALPADAQPGRQGWRVGADTQVSVRGRKDGLPSTGLTIDSLIAAQWGDRTQLIARPVSQGRFDGSWSHDLYQAGIRYQPPTRLPLRLEAGYALPVIGLGLQRSRSIARDMGSFHAHYVTPLPSFETGLPAVYPVTPSYQLVAIASLGMTRWDLRMGVADGSPTRLRGVLRNTGAPRATQLVVGGGVTPMTGLRIGATLVRGDYTDAEESVASTGSDPMPASYHHDPYSDHDDPYSGATFGSTARHLPGKWITSHRQKRPSGRLARTDGQPCPASKSSTSSRVRPHRHRGRVDSRRVRDDHGACCRLEPFFRVTHALSPRWRVAGRYDQATPPEASRMFTPDINPLRLVEGLVAYRVTRELVLRGFFLTRRSFQGPDWDHEAGISFAVSHHWW